MNENSAEESRVEREIGRAREGKKECEGDRKIEKQNRDERNEIWMRETKSGLKRQKANKEDGKQGR